MQVGSTTGNTLAAMLNQQSGNNVTSTSAIQTPEKQESSSSIRKLAQNIDPSNMSRNEARQLADALMKAGDAELSAVFFSQSAVLIPLGNGQFRQPTESDPIMNEKYNMFDAIRSNMEFRQSKGMSIEDQMAALTFLEQFKLMGEVAEVDAYA